MRRSAQSPFFLAVVPFGWLILSFWFVCDDAFITFRYAANFADGLGLRYNLGVNPPVEGYSEFGWAFWLAACEFLGMNLPFLSTLTSAVCAVGLLALVAAHIDALEDLPPFVTLCSVLFFATAPPIFIWATGGMATMPFVLCLFALFDALFRDARAPRTGVAVFAAASATLLRADGVLFVGLIGGIGLVEGGLRGRRDLARAALVSCVVAASLFVAQSAGRWTYYGDWLPNTARVKVAPGARSLARGYVYVMSFVVTFPAFAALALAGPAFGKGTLRVAALRASVVTAGFVVYSLLVGGDFMTMYRFLMPALPFVTIAFAAALARLPGSVALPGAVVLTALCIATSIAPAYGYHALPESLRAHYHFRWNRSSYLTERGQWELTRKNSANWSNLGRALAYATKPGESIIAGGLGAIGYYSNLFIYDRFGLITREVAELPPLRRRSPGHDRNVSPLFFFDRKPTYVDAYVMALPKALKLRDAPRIQRLRHLVYRSRVVELPTSEGFSGKVALVLMQLDPGQ